MVKDFVKDFIAINGNRFNAYLENNKIDEDYKLTMMRDDGRTFAAFSMNDEYQETFTRRVRRRIYSESERITRLGLHQNDKCRLTIRFGDDKFSGQMGCDHLKNEAFLGLPLIVWIDKNQTLEDILSTNLDEDVIAGVVETYRVKTAKRRIVSIKHRSHRCKPHKFLSKDPNSYLIVELDKQGSADAKKCPAWVNEYL